MNQEIFSHWRDISPRRGLLILLRKIKNWLLIISLRTKIMGLIVCTALSLGIFACFLVYSVMNENMRTYLQQENQSIGRELSSMAGEFILLNDFYGLTRLLQQTVANREDLRYAYVMGEDGQVLAHSFGSLFPLDFLNAPAYDADLSSYLKDAAQSTPVRRLTNEGSVWDAMYRLPNNEGLLRVGVSEKRLSGQMKIVLEKLLLGTLAVILLGLIFAGLGVWLIIRPVKNLLDGTRAIRQGDYNVRVREAPRDEIGRLIEAFNDMSHQLSAAEEKRLELEKMRQKFMRASIAAQENERKRVARELHDQTGQALASLMVGLKLLEQGDGQLDVRNIENLRQTISREMDSIHRLVLELRPSVLDDMGLIPALQHYIEEFQRLHGLMVNFTTVGFGKRRVPSYVETCVYRLVQEALTNVARHAQASAIQVLLEWKNDTVRGVIDDDGIGFEPGNVPPKRMGIFGMRERITLVNGNFRIESEIGAGAMVVFDLPVNPL